MSYDLASLMKMGVEDLAELALRFNAPMSSRMGKKELAREVYLASSAAALSGMSQLLEEENIYLDSHGEEHSYYSGQSILGLGSDIDTLLPSEIAETLMSSDSGAQAFAYAYNNPHESLHNNILVSLRQAGVEPADVFSQIPSEYRNSTYVPLPRELRGVLSKFEGYSTGNAGGLDILGGMAGYYDGNDEQLMAEYSTPKSLGGLQVQQAIEAVAASYVSGAGYSDSAAHSHDVAKVSRRLQASLGSGIQSIATQIAHEKAMGKEAYTSYADILPQTISDDLLQGISGAIIPDREGMRSVRTNMRGIAAVYGYGSASNNQTGVTGLSTPHQINEHLDNVNERMLELGRAIGETSKHDTDIEYLSEGYQDRSATITIPSSLSEALVSSRKSSEDYSNFVGPMVQSVIAAPINNSAATPKFASELEFTQRSTEISTSGITFHNVAQNSPEWDALRADNVSASVAGSLLGHNKHGDPLSAIFGAVGFNPLGIENLHNQNFDRGHRLEAVGRSKYGAKFGVEVGQTGFVTNDLYPGLGVSPDGLVGSDGLVEFKAPVANRFFDPSSRPEYLDQVQMQMAVTGRKWADIAQVGENYGNDGKPYHWLGRVDRVHADPEWAAQNAERLQHFGGMIKEGRSLLGAVESGSISKEEFLETMSKAVARGTAEGVEFIRAKNESTVNSYDRVGDTTSSGYGYGHGVRSGFGLSGNGRGGSGNGGSGYVPNWDFAEGKQPLLLSGPDNTSTEEDADFDQSMSKAEFDHNMRGIISGKSFAKEPKEGVGSAIQQMLAGNAPGGATGNLLKLLSVAAPEVALPVAALVGTAQAVSDGIDAMQGEFTAASDAGIFNVNAYTTSNQNFEALGLDEGQAHNLTGNIGNAAATLSVGDPTATSRIVVGSRGLITIQDVRSTTDPSQLVAIAAQRAKARGFTGQQFAGLMSMAGLNGAAAAYSANDTTLSDNAGRHDSIMNQANADAASNAMSDLRNSQISLSPRYMGLNLAEGVLSTGVSSGITGAIADGTSQAVQSGRVASAAVAALAGDIGKASASGADIIHLMEHAYIHAESGGDPHAKNIHGTARGLYQVTDGTAQHPWLGVVPAKDGSDAERARVGHDLFGAAMKHYGSDLIATTLAMHEGPGVIDAQIKKNPSGWKQHLTDEEEIYLRGIDNSFRAGFNTITTGSNAAPFLTNANSAQPATKLDVNVNIKGSTASADVTVNNKSVKRKDVKLNVGGNTHNIVA